MWEGSQKKLLEMVCVSLSRINGDVMRIFVFFYFCQMCSFECVSVFMFGNLYQFVFKERFEWWRHWTVFKWRLGLRWYVWIMHVAEIFQLTTTEFDQYRSSQWKYKHVCECFVGTHYNQDWKTINSSIISLFYSSSSSIPLFFTNSCTDCSSFFCHSSLLLNIFCLIIISSPFIFMLLLLPPSPTPLSSLPFLSPSLFCSYLYHHFFSFFIFYLCPSLILHYHLSFPTSTSFTSPASFASFFLLIPYFPPHSSSLAPCLPFSSLCPIIITVIVICFIISHTLCPTLSHSLTHR